MTLPAKKVFISYSWDSDAHRAEVKALMDWLRAQGIEVIADDLFGYRPPPQGWLAWMQQSIEDADVVLLVCTPRYQQAMAKRLPPTNKGGLGVTWEGAIISQELYNARLHNTKFFPILPENGEVEHIPTVLQAFHCGHRYPSGNAGILGLINDETVMVTPAPVATASALASAAPPAAFVWYCTDESIAKGQVSALAILEIALAVGLYWWLALHSDWPWMMFISLVVAPVLLLRSDKSIARGVEALRGYWQRDPASVSLNEGKLVRDTARLVSVLTFLLLLRCLSVLRQDWSFIWCIVVIYFSSLGVAATASIAIVGVVGDSSVGLISLADLTGESLYKSSLLRKGAAFIFGPFLVLGVLLRALFIRILATLFHPLEGLKRLPQNWRENLSFIDFVHPPELLPKSFEVSSELAVKSLWSLRTTWTAKERFHYSVLILAWYLSAIACRLSLKSTVWFWWPLVLALQPPFYHLQFYAKRERVANWVGWRWAIFCFMLIPMAWLWLPILPNFTTLRQALPKTLDGFLTLIPTPPTPGACFMFLNLACAFSFLMAFFAQNLKNSYSLMLQSPKEVDGANNAYLARFDVLAHRVDRWRLPFIASLFLSGEAYAMILMHAHHPQLVEHLIPWVFRYL